MTRIATVSTMNVITLKRSPSTNPTDAASNPTTSIVPPIFVEGESKLPPEFFFVATKSENCGDVKILRGVALQTQPNRHDCHSGHRSRRQIGQCAKWVQARRTRPQSGPECRSYRVLYSRQSCQGGVTSHMRTLNLREQRGPKPEELRLVVRKLDFEMRKKIAQREPKVSRRTLSPRRLELIDILLPSTRIPLLIDLLTAGPLSTSAWS